MRNNKHGGDSLTELTPIKTSGFSEADKTFEGANRFSDWKFFYVPPAAKQTVALRKPQSALGTRLHLPTIR